MTTNKTTKEIMITTLDNPFNPFTQFEDWYSFDVQQGYNTASYLARVARSSIELSLAEQRKANEEAINSMLNFNLTGNYKKVEMSSSQIEKAKAKLK